MFGFNFGFTFAWALLLLPLVLFLPRASGTRTLRCLTLAVLIIALAQPEFKAPEESVALLIDVSDSVESRAKLTALDLDFSTTKVDFEVYFFAESATRISNPTSNVPGLLETNKTDLARALQVAGSSMAQRILLISDGTESTGNALEALPDFPVDVFPIEPLPNARMVKLLGPNQANPGETVEIVAVIETDQEANILLRPEANNESLKTIQLGIPKGLSSVPFQYQISGDSDVRMKVGFEIAFTQPTADDNLEITIALEDQDPVLVIGDPATALLLKRQGFKIHEGTVADVEIPFLFSSVILRESAGTFTPGQMILLKRYVEDGGGLMMTGGPDSFGLGSWYRTPIEEVLPVNTDLRTDTDLPLVAMVIILDRSQSMGAGKPSKIDLAKEGAIGVVDLAYHEDLLGLVAFSDEALTDWVFELRPATDRGKSEMLNSILAITTRGGTILGPAYAKGVRALSNANASLKHIIVLSDGNLYDERSSPSDGPVETLNQMAAQALVEKITTSTIAIGESADFDVLEAIATSGGGRYYETLDTGTLPRIFTNEALTATRSLLRDDPFQPVTHRHPLAIFGSSPPPPDAYVASTLKPDSEILIEALNNEPLLAVRHHGLGRTAALTTDLNLWGGKFSRWSQLPNSLSAVVRWLQTTPEDFTVYAYQEKNELRIVVDAVRNGSYVNNRNLIVRYLGEERPLEQIGPGRYQGSVSASETSGTLLIADNNEIVARTRVSAPPGEFNRKGESDLLTRIATRTGGNVYDDLSKYSPSSSSSSVPLWPYLILTSTIIFLVELTLRRFGYIAAVNQ